MKTKPKDYFDMRELNNQPCILPKCDNCGNIMKHKGGLLFSPPSYKNEKMVYKYHLCRGCYIAFVKPLIENMRVRKENKE